MVAYTRTAVFGYQLQIFAYNTDLFWYRDHRQKDIYNISLFNFQFTKMTVTNITRTRVSFLCLLVFLLSLDWLNYCNAQAYHFSKGWMPGKKRSQPMPAKTLEGSSSGDFESNKSSSTGQGSTGTKMAGSCQLRSKYLEMLKVRLCLLICLFFYQVLNKMPK